MPTHATYVAMFPATTLAQAPRFEVSYDAAASRGPITSRLIVIIAKTEQTDPRLRLALREPAMAAIDFDQLEWLDFTYAHRGPNTGADKQ